MKIERIRLSNFRDLKDIDWIFPSGPTLIINRDINDQKLLDDLLMKLFYEQESQLLEKQKDNAAAEVWISEDNHHFVVRYENIQIDGQITQQFTFLDGNGYKVNLPEKMTIGEYLFQARLQAFLQGGRITWPEKDSQDNLFLRINNLSQGGDEDFSLTKVRASLIGAQKRVKDQRESMELVKAEYDALRNEWEDAHRQQEANRLLLIEIKNLQENEAILTEKIALTQKIHQRLECLAQNSDYRELRQLQDKICRMEERQQRLDEGLRAISSDGAVDWEIIENFREECMEWACLQKDVRNFTAEIEARIKLIEQTQRLLLSSGYQGYREDEEQQLRRVMEERDSARDRLDKLILLREELDERKLEYEEEITKLSKLIVMSDVTEDAINRITRKEKQLNRWQSYKICNITDQLLTKPLKIKSINERLSAHLLDYYQRYDVANYREFTSRLEEYQQQQRQVENLKKRIEELQEKVNKEPKLLRIIDSRNEIIKLALSKVQAADFSEWLNGWLAYQQMKKHRSEETDQLNKDLEQKLDLEKKLAICAEGMSENLKNWGIPLGDREEVLSAILNVAGQLQERDEVKEEVAKYLEIFVKKLGNRDLERLSRILEPLAELEREQRLSNQERLAEMSSWEKERVEILQHLEELNTRLQGEEQAASLSVLEKRIEVKKRQWIAYEDLRHALNDAQAILDLSWQEWQTKYEKNLSEEKQWIYEHFFSPKGKYTENETVVKRNYFSYRLALAQLALPITTEVPLFFSVGKISEGDQTFWTDAAKYLNKLGLGRQVFLNTEDPLLAEILLDQGWSPFSFAQD